ncbi:hypothetical protein [Amycolatopsis sp. H20-H5]|uniref:hypothetical protein n=1 Tax=Amycolatopsis sp. H20-H5 TaxID=3046309 RepID=UPI002DBF3C1D|nr:hypothetical protein [Amycolatopsis sp. H20-H5]MEC3979834.1 hypothetical protein [Amycolatopsis sp. H20-H5]
MKTQFRVVVERDARTMNGLADILKLPDSASIDAIYLGVQAMTSRPHVVDLTGLSDKEIANHLVRDDLVGMRNYAFDVVESAMITFIEGWGDTRFSEGYGLIYRTSRTKCTQ